MEKLIEILIEINQDIDYQKETKLIDDKLFRFI